MVYHHQCPNWIRVPDRPFNDLSIGYRLLKSWENFPKKKGGGGEASTLKLWECDLNNVVSVYMVQDRRSRMQGKKQA